MHIVLKINEDLWRKDCQFQRWMSEIEKKHKSFGKLTSILESIDTVVNFAPTTISLFLSITGFSLLVLPTSALIACSSPLGKEVKQKIITNKYNRYKKQNEQKQTTIEPSD